MTEPRADGPYAVPVERLPAGRGQRRRAIATAASLMVVVGGAIGLSRLAAEQAAVPNASPRVVAVASVPPLHPSSTPSALRSVGPRVEALLDAPNHAIAGSPAILLLERDGLDIRIVRWDTGSKVSADRTFHAALESGATDILTVLAPTDDRLLVLEPGGSSDPANGRGRLVDPAGRVLWTGEHLAAVSGAAWSPDGRLVVVAGSDRTWHLVRIDDHGVARDRPVALPFRIFLPTPLPTTDLAVPRVDPRTLPLGFSADGRWVYGGVASRELGLLIATFRIAVDGSAVEPVADLGVGRPDGLDPQLGTIGGGIVDPQTGRIATLRVNADDSGGPPTIEVRNPDAGFVFAVGGDTPVGSGWGSDGGLYVLSADAPLFANRLQLVRYAPDGSAGPPLVEMGPITGANLLGVSGSFGAIAVSVTRPDTAIQLIVVDLANPAIIAAVRLPDTGSDGIIGVALRN